MVDSATSLEALAAFKPPHLSKLKATPEGVVFFLTITKVRIVIFPVLSHIYAVSHLNVTFALF
jgi:hypothetical protein